MAWQTFKLESLYLNLKDNKLKINGKEIPLRGITDFSLTAEAGVWHLVARRDVITEISEEHSLQGPAIQETERR